jgi:cyclopropane fatty-acyl-phospholipid synthase-like methyltransferase
METPVSRPETIDRLRYGVDAGFAMLAGMQLDVFTPLKDAPKTAEQIAEAIGVGPARLRLLLYGLVAAGLLTERDGHFRNSPEATQYLVKGNPSYMGNMHELFSHRWTNLYPHTAESIRRSVPQDKVDFSNAPQNGLEAFLRRINRNTVAAARALTRQYDFSSTKTLADVGCGAAGLALTMIKELPHIKATAIDLPLVAPIAQKIVAEEGATDRVHVLAADLLSGPLPGSYDTVILRGVLQCLSAEEARLAVKNIAAAVNPGGTLFIVAQILDDSRISPLEALGYNLIFINTFDAGESYTEQEHRAWLTEAGFVHIERANFLLPDEHGLMTARKPR